MANTDLMEKVISLCKRRGFIFPGSEIYGGLANSWDFGPLGVELKNNIKSGWWRMMVQESTDVLGIETALIMNPKVWEASGHLKEFSDPLVECKKCHERFRTDHLDNKKVCPSCGGELGESKQFNMMLKTFLGPAENSAATVYFRPETAQGMFVNFENVLKTSRKRLPFGIAQVGKSFRNEITPGNFIFRTREFEQMEIEYFIKEDDWKKYFEYWFEKMKNWLANLGIKQENINFIEIPDGERAHYSKRTVDIFYNFPFGSSELYGLAYRGDFDLKNHNQVYLDPETNEKFVPHVIEPTWGVERTVLAVLCEHYHEEVVANDPEGGVRAVLKLPKWLAPRKIAVLPLSRKDELTGVSARVYKDLSSGWICDYDETQSIGKRYRRQDEIGTPYCVTIDFQSLEDDAVTVRERDSMTQTRVKINDLKQYFNDQFHTDGTAQWATSSHG